MRGPQERKGWRGREGKQLPRWPTAGRRGSLHHFESCGREDFRYFAVRLSLPKREAGSGRPRKNLNLKSVQLRAQGNCVGTKVPDGQKVDEEFQRVAMVHENDVTWRQTIVLEIGQPTAQVEVNVVAIPLST